jgi:hypothetical protein
VGLLWHPRSRRRQTSKPVSAFQREVILRHPETDPEPSLRDAGRAARVSRLQYVTFQRIDPAFRERIERWQGSLIHEREGMAFGLAGGGNTSMAKLILLAKRGAVYVPIIPRAPSALKPGPTWRSRLTSSRSHPPPARGGPVGVPRIPKTELAAPPWERVGANPARCGGYGWGIARSGWKWVG